VGAGTPDGSGTLLDAARADGIAGTAPVMPVGLSDCTFTVGCGLGGFGWFEGGVMMFPWL
jgi:hypothetical protein